MTILHVWAKRAGLAVGVGAVVAVGAVAGVAPAYAGGVVTVQGTSFPDPAHVNLSTVGCDALFDRPTGSLTPMLGRGPGEAPLGERSMGFALPGGSAAGAMFTVASMADTSAASLSVRAEGRATGVAYAGYQAPEDAGTSYLWLGRAELSTPGGSWQSVSAIGRTYDWTRFDLTTGQSDPDTAPVPATTVADFAAAHGGDGPGLYTIGFGCNGVPFSVDAFRLGATTYDLEGLTTSITGSADHATVDAGDPVRVSAQLHTTPGEGFGFATMILESRTGSGAWQQEQVVAVAGGHASATVHPSATTSYRWRFVDRPLADGSVSEPVTVTVRDAEAPSASPTSSPTASPSRTPSPSLAPTPTADPTSEAPSESPTPSETPSEAPSETATPSEVASSPAAAASESPMSAEPTPGQ